MGTGKGSSSRGNLLMLRLCVQRDEMFCVVF